jgi:hypothetical protein
VQKPALAVAALVNGAECAIAQLVVSEAFFFSIQHVHTNLHTMNAHFCMRRLVIE